MAQWNNLKEKRIFQERLVYVWERELSQLLTALKEDWNDRSTAYGVTARTFRIYQVMIRR